MTTSHSEMCYLNKLCFLCLTYNKNVLNHVDSYLKVQDKLEYFLPEQILQKTGTPRYVCDNCVDRLDSINEFRKKCLENIIIFNDYIKKKHECLSVTLNSRNLEIVNQTCNNFENTNEKPNCVQNIKTEIFETESFEPIKDDESKEIFCGNNIQQIFIKTENIEDENIEESSIKNEIKIINDDPFLYENCNEDTQLFNQYNTQYDNTSVNRLQETFVDVNSISPEEKFNKNSQLSFDEYSSSCDTSIKNDLEPTKNLPVKEEGEVQNRKINSDECDIQKKLEIHNDVDTEEKPYTCEFCPKQFKQKANLFRHKRLHTGERPFVCNICDRAFSDKSNLANHKRLHAAEKPFECDVCKKAFKVKYNLVDHKLVHSDEKPHKCDVCQKPFKKISDLNKHKRVHSAEKQYSCDICKKKFTHKFNLTQHQRTHTGEKPFECDVCKKAFTKKFNLNQHKLIHTGEKPHECDFCKKTFTLKAHLIQHQGFYSDGNCVKKSSRNKCSD